MYYHTVMRKCIQISSLYVSELIINYSIGEFNKLLSPASKSSTEWTKMLVNNFIEDFTNLFR